MRQFVSLLLFIALTIGFGEQADAQFWKKKSKRHSHKNKHNKKEKQKEITTKTEEDSDIPEEDDRMEVKEPVKTKAQKKKEKQEKKRKEKEERKKKKEKEKLERRALKAKKQEEKKNKNKKIPNSKSAEPIPVTKKLGDIDYAPTQKKSHYRIDLLAPMYLDELVKNGYPVKDIPEKAVKGLDFYKGVQIAADTLKKAQFTIDIYVHDVASISESSEMLVRKNALDSSDLILGAVADKDVPCLAAFAKKKQINFISAIATSDGNVKDNPYFTILQPSLQSYCKWITANLENTFPKGKVLLLHRSMNATDENAYRYLTEDPNSKNLFFNLLCNTAPGKEAISLLIDSTVSTIVVVAVNDVKYADSLLKILRKDFPATHFEIYGMPSLNAISNTYKQGVYPNFTFDMPMPFMYDNAPPIAQYVDQTFKKEYGGKPTEMVYRGFEVLYWYANMLKNYGTVFNKTYMDNDSAPMTPFEVKPQLDTHGNVLYYENRHLSLKKIVNSPVTEPK